MVNQNELADTLQRLMSGAGGDAGDLELRSKVGRLSFSAGRFADRSNCPCQGCQWLRESNDLLMAEEAKGGANVAQSQHPQP